MHKTLGKYSQSTPEIPQVINNLTLLCMICWTHKHAWADRRNTYNCPRGRHFIQEPDFSGCFVWRGTEYSWLSLNSGKLRRLWACRWCTEHCRRCSAFKSSGNCGPNFGWCHSLPGSLKKNGFTFPMVSGSSFNILLCPCCSLAVCCGGKPEPDKEYSMSPSGLRAPTAVSTAGAVQWSAPFCQWAPVHQLVLLWAASEEPHSLCQCSVHKHAVDQAGGLVMEHPDVGGFPPEAWQRRAAVCVSCPSPKLCSSVQLLRLSLHCM